MNILHTQGSMYALKLNGADGYSSKVQAILVE